MDDKKSADGGRNKDLGLLEEDDEFEEFPEDDWDFRKEDSGDAQMWEVRKYDESISPITIVISILFRTTGTMRILRASSPIS